MVNSNPDSKKAGNVIVFLIIIPRMITTITAETGDLSKPFFFIDGSNKLGIFKFFRGRAKKIRTLEDTTVRTKPRRNFKKSVDHLTPASIKRKFVKKAERVLGR